MDRRTETFLVGGMLLFGLVFGLVILPVTMAYFRNLRKKEYSIEKCLTDIVPDLEFQENRDYSMRSINKTAFSWECQICYWSNEINDWRCKWIDVRS